MSLVQKQQIEKAIRQFGSGSLTQNALHLFNTLGYNTERQAPLEEPSYLAFREAFVAGDEKFNDEKALVQEWRQVDLLFQLSKAELTEQHALFDTGRVNNTIIESYLFFAIELTRDSYTRTELSHITREVNRLFPMPVMLLFKHGSSLTLSVINRRLHKKDESKDVLEKVTVIKDIRIEQPHRAHVEILFDLSMQELYRRHHFQNFVELHRAWQQTLDTKELNKRFFQELANWYFWAQQHVQFPDDLEKEEEVRNATSLIRLITRVVFIWFIREKDLVPDQLFNEHFLRTFLKGFQEKSTADSYYKAILQNLFFGTLNQKMGERAFTKEGSYNQNRTEYGVKNLFRYGSTFTVPEQQVLDLFGEVPFLNGGLFDCLDKPDESGKIQYVDGFSRNPQKQAHVPDFLFFSEEQEVDLNPVFGTKNKKYKVRGLICLLDSYKFTVTENTPVEEEIALDPELLGKVFENLLASYNPETKTTARKQTGSFYTPREVVNYMVDESLIAYLKPSLQQAQASGLEPGQQQPEPLADAGEEELETNLRHLLAYTEEPHRFSPSQTETLIRAIHDCKILDPACGSGAYPMGILHKLVHVLHKLDPDNVHWRELQRQKAIAETEEAFRIGNQQERLLRLHEIDEVFELNASDYGRKLYLIENCIYGVDIQPVAVQIAKLRFFISLIIDERKQPGKDNQGIRSLPNLETKFVAANTLFGLDRPAGQGVLQNQKVLVLEDKLKEIRHRYFGARTRREKLKYQQEDKQLRQEIAQLLVHDGMKPGTAKEIVSFDPYDQNASARFFDPEWMFGLTEGFDLVIGNPPYVRSEKLKDQKTAFKQQFPRCFTGTADLYVFFYERAIQVLRKGGVLCYITPNKYLKAGYGKLLREFLAKYSALLQLIDFGEAPVFDAIAYPSIVLMKKQTPPLRHEFKALNWKNSTPIEDFPSKFISDNFKVPQSELQADGWRLENRNVQNLFKKLRENGKPLNKYVEGRVYRGVLTGLNEAFVISGATRKLLINEDARSVELIKPYLRGRDIKRWVCQPTDLWLIFTRRGTKIDKYPAIKRHLLQYKDKLDPGTVNGRKAGSYQWFEIQDNIAYWKEFEEPKIIWPGISASINSFCFDDKGYFGNDNINLLINSEKYLLGVLNSSVVKFYLKNVCDFVQGGFCRLKISYVSTIPVPIGIKYENQINDLVSKVLKAKKDGDLEDLLEQQIDQMVYKLYKLTWEEVLLVEPDFEQRHGMGQEAYEALEFGGVASIEAN